MKPREPPDYLGAISLVSWLPTMERLTPLKLSPNVPSDVTDKDARSIRAKTWIRRSGTWRIPGDVWLESISEAWITIHDFTSALRFCASRLGYFKRHSFLSGTLSFFDGMLSYCSQQSLSPHSVSEPLLAAVYDNFFNAFFQIRPIRKSCDRFAERIRSDNISSFVAFSRLLEIFPNYWRCFQIVRDFSRLLEIFPDCWIRRSEQIQHGSCKNSV